MSPSTGSVTYVVPSYYSSAHKLHTNRNLPLQRTPIGLSDITRRHGVSSGLRIKREGGSCREWWQQEQLWERGVAPNANRKDLVILGKVDEIPRTDTLEALRGCQFEAKNDCAILEGSTFQYSYSGYAGPQPGGPKVLPSEVRQLI